MMKNTIISLIFALFISSWLLSPVFAAAVDTDSQTWYGRAYENIRVRGDILGYGAFNDVADSQLNPFNIIGIPGKQLEAVLRPDFFMACTEYPLTFELKPRLSLSHTQWDDGVYQYKSSEGEAEAYINEWQIRYGISQRLFVSGGRENLQWGPSYLFSPSNPFFGDNGRNNPYLELPGLDYAKVFWIISDAWSYSMVANIGKGRSDPLDKFRNIYAMKLDYTGFEKYLSLITSKKKQDKSVFGFFGGITVTDYLLVHMEGNYSFESEKTDILAGSAYTFSDGSTLAVEYFYQGSGCTDEPIEQCIVSEDFYAELQERFEDFDGTIDELLGEIESLNLRFGNRNLIRKNYLMAQYIKPRIKDVVTITGRWIYNIDDGSSRVVGIGNWEINNHLAFLAVGNVFTGGSDTEFGSLFNHSLMLGLTYSF